MSGMEVALGTQSSPSSGRRRSRLPTALLCALGIWVALSGATWLGLRQILPGRAHTVLVLGDSVLAGYRMAKGNRFEDWLQRELGPDWTAVNFAAPASQPGDYYLQLAQAELLGVKPELVVIGLTPHKLVPEVADSPRLAEDGINLRWLPFTAEGKRFYSTLTPHEQRMTWVYRAGLLFGFCDMLQALWREQVEWPINRYQRARRSPEQRRTWMASRARELDERWQNVDAELARLRARRTREIRDLAFLVDALRARHTRVAVLMTPGFHTGVYQTLSARTLENLQQAYRETLALCSDWGLAVLDFNRSSERVRFLPAQWEDLQHLRSPDCFRRMAHAVQRFVRAQLGAAV